MLSTQATIVAWVLAIYNFRMLDAIAWHGADPTAMDMLDDTDLVPGPTNPPLADLAKHDAAYAYDMFALNRRQNGLDICGWQDQISTMAVYCGIGFRCAEDPYNYGAGCCTTAVDVNSCYLPTECLPYNPTGSTSSFDTQALSNLYTTSCSSLDPYCFVRSYLFSSNQQTFYEVGCTTLSQTDQTVYDSYSGQTTGLGSTPNIATISVTRPDVDDGGPLAGSSSVATADTNGTSGGGGSTSNTGAIVGGVVGGLGGLALIIGLIVFCCLRRRKKKYKDESKKTKHNRNFKSQSYSQEHQYYYGSSGPNPPPVSQLKSTSGSYDFIQHNKVVSLSSASRKSGRYDHHAQPQKKQHSLVSPGHFHQQHFDQPSTSQYRSQTMFSQRGGTTGGTGDQTSAMDMTLTSECPIVRGASRFSSLADENARGGAEQPITDASLVAYPHTNRRAAEIYETENREERQHRQSQSTRQEDSIAEMTPSLDQNMRNKAGLPSAMSLSDQTSTVRNSGAGVDDVTADAGKQREAGSKSFEQGHARDEVVYYELSS